MTYLFTRSSKPFLTILLNFFNNALGRPRTHSTSTKRGYVWNTSYSIASNNSWKSPSGNRRFTSHPGSFDVLCLRPCVRVSLAKISEIGRNRAIALQIEHGNESTCCWITGFPVDCSKFYHGHRNAERGFFDLITNALF